MNYAFKNEEGKVAILDYYNMLLENLTVPYEKINLNTTFGNTFIIAARNATNIPIVLLHGSSMNSAMWINDIKNFSKDYPVYAVDLPGEPGRSDERQLPFDTLDYSHWLLEVLNGLSIDKAIIVGISLGAFVALKFSVNHPDRLHKLVLLCPAGVGSQNHEFKDIALSLLPKGEKGLNELFNKINGDIQVPEIILNYQKLIAMFFNIRQEEIPLFKDEELKNLTMPTIVFVGEKDIMLRSFETVNRFSKVVPQVKTVVLKDKGHSLVGLSKEILDFIKM